LIPAEHRSSAAWTPHALTLQASFSLEEAWPRIHRKKLGCALSSGCLLVPAQLLRPPNPLVAKPAVAPCACCHQVAGRIRDVHTAGQASKLAAQLAEADSLSKEDYLAVINSQFWLKQDHKQLLQTVAAMKAAGHELNEQVLQQLLHVYCHNGMWGEALQVLDDVAAGRFSSSKQPGQHHHPSKGGRRHGDTAAAGVGDHTTIDNDKLWHVVMRKLWERRASDALLNEFLQHMAPAQLQRFKLLYGLQLIPGQQQYTLKPVEDWHLPLQAPTSATSASSSTSTSTSSEM